MRECLRVSSRDKAVSDAVVVGITKIVLDKQIRIQILALDDSHGGEAERRGGVIDRGIGIDEVALLKRFAGFQGDAEREQIAFAQPDVAFDRFAVGGALVEESEAFGAGALMVVKNDDRLVADFFGFGDGEIVVALVGGGEEEEERSEVGDGTFELGVFVVFEGGAAGVGDAGGHGVADGAEVGGADTVDGGRGAGFVHAGCVGSERPVRDDVVLGEFIGELEVGVLQGRGFAFQDFEEAAAAALIEGFIGGEARRGMRESDSSRGEGVAEFDEILRGQRGVEGERCGRDAQ